MQQNTLPFPKKCEHRYAATATKLFTLRTPVETNNEAQGGCSDGKFYYQVFLYRDNASGQEHNEVRIAKFDVERGEVVVIIGPSGSGKSTHIFQQMQDVLDARDYLKAIVDEIYV